MGVTETVAAAAVNFTFSMGPSLSDPRSYSARALADSLRADPCHVPVNHLRALGAPRPPSTPPLARSLSGIPGLHHARAHPDQ